MNVRDKMACDPLLQSLQYNSRRLIWTGPPPVVPSPIRKCTKDGAKEASDSPDLSD